MFYKAFLRLFEYAVRDCMSDKSFQKLRLKARQVGKLWVRYSMVLGKTPSDTITIDAMERHHVIVLHQGKRSQTVSALLLG